MHSNTETLTNYVKETKIIVSEDHDEAGSAIYLGMQIKKKKKMKKTPKQINASFCCEIGHYLTIYLTKYFPAQERSCVGIRHSDSISAYSSTSQG